MNEITKNNDDGGDDHVDESEEDDLFHDDDHHEIVAVETSAALELGPDSDYSVLVVAGLTYRKHLSDVSKVTYPIITSELFQNTLPVM